MHEALHVWLAANLVAQLIEKANEENLHLTWATQRCNFLESSGI